MKSSKRAPLTYAKCDNKRVSRFVHKISEDNDDNVTIFITR